LLLLVGSFQVQTKAPFALKTANLAQLLLSSVSVGL
jgi:hypothetical protein